jgi:hypothetical protein
LAEVSAGVDGAYARQRVVPQPDAETLGRLSYVRSLERPRQVQFNKSARRARTVTKIFPIGMWLWGTHDLLFPHHPISMAAHGPIEARVWAIVVLGCGTLMWVFSQRLFENKREFTLLKEGQVVLGRVVGSTRGLMRSPGVTYEFRDSQGRLLQGEGSNMQEMLNEDSHVVVFYDPQTPENSVALDATNYELAKP